MKIAVDAMGGDHAPRVVVEGMSLAVKHGLDPERLMLVGRQEAVEPLLREFELENSIQLLHAAQVIEMHESPAARPRPGASALWAQSANTTSDPARTRKLTRPTIVIAAATASHA